MEKGQVTYLEILKYTSVFLDIENSGLMDWRYCRYVGMIHVYKY